MEEKLAEGDMIAANKKFKRSPKGKDYEYYDSDDLGRKKARKKFLEVKSNKAKLSKLQKQKAKKEGKNYTVARYQV